MELDKNGNYPTGLSGEEVNEFVLNQLFVGNSERTVAVSYSSEDKSKSKISVTYVVLTSADDMDLSLYYETQLTNDLKRRMKILTEAARSIRKINGKSLEDSLFDISFYEKHQGDFVVKKGADSGDGETVNRDLSKDPLIAFEKRYLVLLQMPFLVVELIHIKIRDDTYDLFETLVGSPKKEVEDDKKKLKVPEGKEANPL